MKPYSAEMRRDVLEMTVAGMSTREIRHELEVSESWIRRVKQEYRESGKTAPAIRRNRRNDWDDHADWLRRQVDQQPDIYLRELVAAAEQQRNWTTSEAQMCRALKALGITRKKRRSSPPNNSAKM
ncbi:IS630 transposase-related protein [Calycomorphotria hydatis]|uniref:Transposase n=1 Tax=Calycomorphotria hydatis TaxID=2528027 RepID=A0A517TAC1_9PLAN|nr:IS630 transposase-related protein [Calycomorphotria hydatis]QDT63112.1 Transposase [Calycomorphotria hydatis]QDT63615.1 Transposase [Calycomorphotria hydatis]QDT64088.1 Transposase [Calycomorphotria hydatis]QDT65322.1 Transposase [Calycomorphotria hydatis]QDT66276.1 Transposase [Calycomorphotria hydatis]